MGNNKHDLHISPIRLTQGFPRRRLRMVLEMSQLFPGRREAEALNQGVAQDEGPAAMVPDGPQIQRNNMKQQCSTW